MMATSVFTPKSKGLLSRWPQGGMGSFLAGVVTSALAFAILPLLPLSSLPSLPSIFEPVQAVSLPERAIRIKLPDAPELQQIAEAPHPELDTVGLAAEVKNDKLPFARTAGLAATPFTAVNMASGSGQTALQCMTQAVYYEAARESLSGRRAVAQVVLNRMRHPAFPKSVCGVVYQGSQRTTGCQFSFTCDGSLARRPNPELWSQARQIASEALEGHVESAVGYATHYHANYVYPYWAPKLVKLAKIGAHIFYRWPGGWGRPAAFQGQYAGFEAIPAWRRASVQPQTAGAAGAAGSIAGPPVSLAEAAGRIDTSTGWRIHASDPYELDRSSKAISRRQSGINALLEDETAEKTLENR